MTTEIAIPEEVSTDIINIEHLDTPEKRFNHLSRSFTTAIVVIAEMQRKRDWENLVREDGTKYESLTEMVQDALKISDSYARRLVQTSTVFYTPLEAVTVEGTVINITATEAAKLGTKGMEEVVDKVKDAIDDNEDPDFQTNLIEAVKDDVLKTKNAGGSNAMLDDFNDDFLDEEFDDIDFDDDDLNDPSAGSEKKPRSTKNDDLDFEDGFEEGSMPTAPDTKPSKKDDKKQPPSDYLGPIEKIMSGGKEYKTEEDIAELPVELQEFVRAVNYLASLDSVELSEMITEERRGVTYSIRKAASNLTLVVSATETSSWVLEQI